MSVIRSRYMRNVDVPYGDLPDEMSVLREYLHSGGGNISQETGTSFQIRGQGLLWSLPAPLIPSVAHHELPRALHDSHLGRYLHVAR